MAIMNWKQPSDALRQLLLTLSYDGGVDKHGDAEAFAYYDGYQETQELKRWRDDRGQQSHMVNLYQQHINAVNGMEIQRQTDWKAVADDDEGEDVAEATNVIINEMSRLHDINDNSQDAVLSMLISGDGWFCFDEGNDPVGMPLDVHWVPNDEIIADTRRSRRLDMGDMEAQARRRFVDKPQAKQLFPGHEDLIDFSFSRHNDWGPLNVHGGVQHHTGIWSDVDTRSYGHHLYRNINRDEVAIFEVWYRVYEKVQVLYLNGLEQGVEYDPDDLAHVSAVLDGFGRVKKESISKMRVAWFIGPHLVEDTPTYLPHQMFKYIRCMGLREQQSGRTHALGRLLKGPQDSFNMALTQFHALQERVTVVLKGDALAGTDTTAEDVQVEAHKGDGVIEIGMQGDVDIIHHTQQLNELRQTMEIARENMRAATGIGNTFTGMEESQKSGVAMQTAVEQSVTSLAKLTMNIMFFRKMIGRHLLAHAIKRYGSTEVSIPIKTESGEERKVITLNATDETGKVTNSLRHARMQIAMADVQTSAGFRAQNHLTLQQAAQSAPEVIQPELYIGMLENSTIPKRQELIQSIKTKLNVGTSEEERKAIQESAAEQQQAEREMEMAEREAEVEFKRSQTELNIAKAEEARAKAGAEQQAMQSPGNSGDSSSAMAAQKDELSERREKMKILQQMREQAVDRQLQG